MATNATRSQMTANSAAAAVAKEQGSSGDATRSSARGRATASPLKPSGYGLPCSKCHLYYAADLEVCPTCHHNQRSSAVAPKVAPRMSQIQNATGADNAAVEREREEFLRQFKSQLLEAHSDTARAEVAHGTVAKGTERNCNVGDHHSGEAARAEVCKACYERLQERLDACQAALYLDLTEAAQIIYDAVWADPSNPGQTYQNAASALLTELRKQAGMKSVQGPIESQTD